MKFDETLAKEQNWREFKLTDKYTTVIIESPDIIDVDDRISMIMRNEDMFTSDYGSGNDTEFADWCLNLVGYPRPFPIWVDTALNELCSRSVRDELLNAYENEVKKFEKSWNINPEPDIFEVNLLGSFYGEPCSFVNFETGKVGNVTKIGKFCEHICEFEDEIEWFSKTYPQYKFFLTFKTSEDGYGENSRNTYTLRLFNGKVEVVTTRTDKETKYIYKINHFKGSTCARRYNIIDYISLITRVYKVKNFIIDKLSKLFPSWGYNYSVKKLEEHYEHRQEKYFDKAHARDILTYWLQKVKSSKSHNND